MVPKSTGAAYVLWFFFGLVGAHRAYLGHWGWFVVYLVTIGGCGILWLIDIFRVPGMVRMNNLERAAYGR